MVKVKLRAGKESVEQAQSGGDFGEPPRPGLYHFELASIEKVRNKDGKGEHLNCRWATVGIGREGKKPEEKLGSVWDRVSLTAEDAEWARARLALALGAKPNRAGNVDLSLELDATKPDSPVGTRVLGRVKGGKDLNDDYQANMAWYGPLDAMPESGEGFEDEEGESDAFNGDDEEEATEPFDEEEEEYLTQEELEAMDNEKLAETAKEFDLVPKDLAVKVRGKTNVPKTRAAIIEAILEAQGAEEDEEGEDPF